MFALEGISIIDLTKYTPGTYCTMLLGDMGADVVRVEEPAPPTTGRRAVGATQTERSPEEVERALAFDAMHRNKRSIALNLRDERARRIMHQLCERADVLVEGFRPGVSKRLGVDYDTLSKLNSRLVYCSLSGYGQNGPYSTLAGHDVNYIAAGGALAMIGDAPNDRPSLPLNLLADFAGGGALAAYGILCALMSRERTGQGQYIDVAMSDGVTQLITSEMSRVFQTGKETPRGTHNLSGAVVHYNVYQCQDGKWMSVGSFEPYFYENFCRAVGREDWLPNEGADLEAHAIMISQAKEIFRTKSRDEWFTILNASDQCAMVVLEPHELADNAHIRAREMVIELDHPSVGKVLQTGVAPKLSATPGGFRSFAARSGQHTNDVLAGLGLSQGEIDELRAAGAVR